MVLSSPAPSVTLTGVTLQANQTVTISGKVSSMDPGNCSVAFSGAVSGLVSTSPAGFFQYTTSASQLGVIDATATDAWGQTSNTATAMLSSPAPSVTLNPVTVQGGQTVTVTGQVSGAADPGPFLVSLSGVVSGQVQTNPDGTFSYISTTSGTGVIDASTTDVWGQSSNTAQTTLSYTAPTLTLNAAPQGDGSVLLTGQVSDADPSSCTVAFSGALSGSVSTNPDGSFSFIGTASGLGIIDAVATDSQGLTSSTAAVDLSISAPSLTLSVTPQGGQVVTVSGRVSDLDAGNCSVSFSGVVSGSVQTNPDGSFSYTTTASGLGVIDAVATDVWGLTSNTAQTQLSVAAPDISLAITGVQGQQVTLIGTVSAGSPAGLSVQISGVASAWVQTDQVGVFQTTVTASQLGAIDAVATDAWGQTSNTAEVILSSPAPSVTLTGVTLQANQTVTISGKVSSMDPGNCSVAFSGALSGSVSTNPDGSFQYTSASQLGTIEATAIDAWGQTSNTAETVLSSPAPSVTLNPVTVQGGQTVTVTGQVSDAVDPGPFLVSLSGVVSGQVRTNPNGTFSYTSTASGTGVIDASTTDVWGQSSNTAQTNLSYTSPTLTLNATPQRDGSVLLTGQVSDADPSSCTVAFSGVVSGSVQTKPDGSFSYTTPASGLGVIAAVATDSQGLTSSTVAMDLNASAPQLTLSVTPQGGQVVTVSGQVSDLDAGDCSVSFSGVVSGSVQTNPDGSFRYTTTASGLGTIDAVATDRRGLHSNTAEAELTDSAPTLTLNVTPDHGQMVTISGQVSGVDSGFCLVSFSGIVSGSVSTNPDGTFSLTTTASGLGTLSATATDSWGVASGTVQTQLNAATPSVTVSATQDWTNIVTLTGQVTGPDPTADLVVFSGALSSSVTPAADGSFSLMTRGAPVRSCRGRGDRCLGTGFRTGDGGRYHRRTAADAGQPGVSPGATDQLRRATQ